MAVIRVLVGSANAASSESPAMTPLFERLDATTLPPEISRPDPARRVTGDPVFTTWNRQERDGLHCGLWQATPGCWRVSYTEWEYCRILSGSSVITGADGSAHHVRAGDSFVLRPGFEGLWQVIETTTKDYVIVL